MIDATTHAARLVLVLAMAAGAAAQDHAPSLHRAWLREVLDLDLKGAARGYARVADDAAAPTVERMVAGARLVELRRLGVDAPPPPELGFVPEGLRAHFAPSPTAAADPVLERELELAAGARAPLRAFLQATHLPPLRPLVLAAAQTAAEEADPGRARARRTRTRYLPWSNDPARVLDRIRANQIVQLELDGRRDDAAAERAITFASWRPAPWPADAGAAWQRVLANLDSWLRERELTAAEIELLRRLRAALTAAAQREPAAAFALIDRLPLYAERLRVGVDEGR
ncbi:MAG: hypothetical protein AB7O97_00665 [Planctomycetota bacterium]